MSISREIWGFDGTIWRKVLIDNTGRLRVDIAAMTMAAGLATAAHQVTQITALQLIDDLRNALGSVNTDDLQVDVKDIADGEIKCYGYDGGAWQRLRVESAADANLRTRLYDGANGIDSKTTQAAVALGRGLNVYAMAAGYTGGGNTIMVWAGAPSSDASSADLTALYTKAHLYGYNGTSWDRLRVDAAFRLLTNSMLYDGANAIDSDQLDSNIFVSGDRGLLVRAQICGYNLEPFHQRRTDSDALAAVSRELCQMTVSALYGFNGATFDRLRTYPTGILKVGRAEGGLSTHHGQASATVKATPGSVYWVTIVSRDGTNGSWVVIRDGGSAGAVKWEGGVIAVKYSTLHAVLDLPIECGTAIYKELGVDGGGTLPVVTVGYL